MALIDDSFDAHRPMLMRTAYRMLGSLSDAEDVVQEAFLRWAGADRDSVAVPGAFLRRIVTRLCLDHLKSARVRRETYTGPWLPDPLVEDEPVEDVTLPLMLALERLSPLERAAFLLHDVFGESFESIAEAIDRDPAACRQLAARARGHVRSERPRYAVDRNHGMDIAEAFFRPRAARVSGRSARCWRRRCISTATAAASAPPPGGCSMGWRRCCAPMPPSRGCVRRLRNLCAMLSSTACPAL